MHFTGEFSAEKCFYLGRQLDQWHFRLDSICKSTLLDFFLMWGLFVSAYLTLSCFSGLLHLFVNYLYIFLSTSVNLVAHQGFSPRFWSMFSIPGCENLCMGCHWMLPLLVVFFVWHTDTTLLKETECNNALSPSCLLDYPITTQVLVQLVPLSALAIKMWIL